MLVPWLIWTVGVAAINLSAVVALRGRWGRSTLVLALAALVGTAVGNAVAGVAGMELVVLGEFHLVEATIGAQVAMGAVLVLAALLASPSVPRPGRDGGGQGR